MTEDNEYAIEKSNHMFPITIYIVTKIPKTDVEIRNPFAYKIEACLWDKTRNINAEIIYVGLEKIKLTITVIG
jgi:hypothetical protein